jgi:hypothetical protein
MPFSHNISFVITIVVNTEAAIMVDREVTKLCRTG